MMWALWLAVALLVTWVGVVWLYVAITHAKALVESGAKFSFAWTGPLYLGLAVGLLLDFCFNLSFGTVIFLEPPRELLFTSRVKRHARTSDGWRKARAIKWAQDLNRFEPGHVKL